MDIQMNIQHGKAYKQRHRPICGIYAFLNGILHDDDQKEKLQKCYVNKIANQIWDMALSSISLNNTNKYNRILDKNDILKDYSLVGEFYDSVTLVNFFIQKHDSIIKLLQQYSLDINYEITDNFKHKNLELYDDQIKENCFYLIPINSNRGWGKNKNNMHWICYKKCDKNLVIFNSGDEVTEKRAKRNAALCKSTIRSKYILNTYELLEVWKNMYNRETDYRNKKNLELYFDFYKWKPKLLVKFFKKHTTKYPSNYWNRIDKINKGCKYSFEKSNFNIVKVTIK